MEKILLAVGHRQLEDYLESQLKREYQFVGAVVHRDGVVRQVGQKNPNIVIIRETLSGQENILSVIYDIRTRYPKVRIIFVAGDREPGDALLASLVSYGVYDILYGKKIQANEIIRLIRRPNEYKDVQHLQPKPVLDEKKNEVLFKAPDVNEKKIVKEIIKEVYLENESDSDSASEKSGEQNKSITEEPTYYEELERVSEDIVKALQKEKQAGEVEEDADTSKVAKEKKKLFFVFKTDEKSQPEESSSSFLFKQGQSSSGKEKILAFMGAKSGVGNTSIAFNFAVYLAQKKNRVIFIEMNDRTPAVRYWYEIGLLDDGIDSVLKGLEENRFDAIGKAIVRSADLKKLEEADLKQTYRKFPHTLDFMVYSNRYLTRNEEEPLNKELTKDLYLHLLFQEKYDYIILDIAPTIWEEDTMNGLLYSNNVFLTLTQDVSVVGNSVYLLNELTKKGVNIFRKTHYIVNKFDKAQLTLKDLKEWIEVDELTTVPMLNREFINANYVGMPMLLTQKNTQIKTVMRNLEKKI